ncbi:hypothetical protein GCM10022381_27020 [Leifsonia kafniensis]|uniref:Nucleotidyltransferase-like protein n=1 Tax=Leifsonia kafniensis TaxID=475957 RepID=A0ABP7KN80_9MICO
MTPEAIERLWNDRVDTHVEIARLSATLRIRLLAACGPVVSHFGFVSPTVISTASVLVDPASTTHLLEELTLNGWVVDDLKGTRLLPRPSVTLRHPDKTCLLNVYYLMPGSRADPEDAFDLLWERRSLLQIGDLTVPSLDRTLVVLLLALALTGQLPGSSRAVNGFEVALVRMKAISTPDEIDDIVTTAWQLHATAALHGLLTAWDREFEHVPLLPERYAMWRLKVGSADRVTRALLAVVEAPRGRRSAVAKASLQHLERFPGPVSVLRSARIVVTAKARLQNATPSDPRGSGWSAAAASLG